MNVLITGASSGIGLELAKVCAADGHNLVLVSRNMTRIEDLEYSGQKVSYISLDLSVNDSAKSLYDEVKKLDIDIDALINNAGFGDFGLFVDSDMSKLSSMIHLNILTLTELTRLFAADMVEKGRGKIMNLASTAAFLPGPYMSVYFATKHYVLAFSEAIAEELSSKDITVTALCPGPTASNFQKTSDMDKSRLVKGKKLPTSLQVAQFGYRAMMRGDRVAIHGVGNRIQSYAVKFLPRNIATKIVAKLSKPK
jgi:uncharacterized protein